MWENESRMDQCQWFIDNLFSQVIQAELREVWLTAGGLELPAGCLVCGLVGFWSWAGCPITHSPLISVTVNLEQVTHAVNQAVKKIENEIWTYSRVLLFQKRGRVCTRNLLVRLIQQGHNKRQKTGLTWQRHVMRSCIVRTLARPQLLESNEPKGLTVGGSGQASGFFIYLFIFYVGQS